ncbi:MAG: hypothetical protein ACE5QF_00680 [Thermoplasmata archaeon]
MAEIRTREEILKRLADKYERNPKGWSVLVKESKSGYSDFLISTEDELWQIKVDSLYRPNPKAIGARIGGRTEARKVASASLPGYGFRPLPSDILDRFLGGEFEREEFTHAIDSVLSTEPKRLSEIDSPGMIQGPLQFGWKGQLSEKQRLLDAKLRRSLDRTIFKEGLGLGYA